MKPVDRIEFMKWYQLQLENGLSKGGYDNNSELLKYCIMDVTVLRQSCMKFKTLLIDQTGLNPFTAAVTIAGVCMAVFRSNYLKKDQIPIEPKGGYRKRDKQSIVAMEWMEWIAHKNKITIESASNGREFRIAPNIKVDGFHRESNTVYEFHGCYFHGCEKCFPHQTAEMSDGIPFALRFGRTINRSIRIRNDGYRLVEKWECEFKAERERNPKIDRFLTTLPHIRSEPLQARDALFGGRTNCIKLHHKVEADEKIMYKDVVSLYPTVLKYENFPVGHPKILIGDGLKNRDVFNIEGLIKATVLPREDLYHPVLPIKMHNKLMFVLCFTCGETFSNEDCTHTSEERKFTGTYVAEELREAVNQGYKILEIHEAWEYEMAKYSPKDSSDSIFAEYINFFLKMKVEASGYPSWCNDDDDKKQEFVKYFQDREGVALDPTKIMKNSGLRSLAKLCLNSLWGKLAQREERILAISRQYYSICMR